MLALPLRTERLDLAPLTPLDRDAFVAYRRDPEVARWQSWSPGYSVADADALLAAQPVAIEPMSGSWMQIAAHDRAGGALVGDVAVHALADQPDTYELGVTFARAHQGRGLAAEAVAGLAGALFRDLAAHRLLGVVDARNEPAARLFARLGFRHEGRAVEADWFKGEWSSVDTWAVLRSEWGRKTA